MRIAQISPLWESVPPQRYGGTERVVSYLTEELVRLGHDVTLFASGDSRTAAKLEAMCPQALRLNTAICNYNAPPILMLERAFGSGQRYDVLHSHLDFFGFPLARRCKDPVVHTVHGRLDLPELQAVFAEYAEMSLVSISNAQRQPLPAACWQGTVYHGLPRMLYRYHPGPGGYLAFLGRMSPEKRPGLAIDVALRTGMPLRIAAKVDPADGDYFDVHIAPRLAHPFVDYLGEISDVEKDEFLGNAYALLAPFDWPEPFGLVLIEALACGTPVIAYRRGAMPEIVHHGVTGFICDTVDAMVEAVEQVGGLDRAGCREAFEQRFTVERMAQDYLALYEQISTNRTGKNGTMTA